MVGVDREDWLRNHHGILAEVRIQVDKGLFYYEKEIKTKR